MLPLAAFYFTFTSSVGQLGSPFSPGPLSIWSNWISLRISPPSPIPTLIPTVLVTTPEIVQASATPSTAATSSPSTLSIVVESGAQLALASEMLVELMEANFDKIGSSHQSPPPSSPSLLLSEPDLLLDASPTPTPSPTEPLRATRTQSKNVVERCQAFDTAEVKGCFVDDPRACPNTSLLDTLLDSLADPSTVFLVLVMAMVCAIGISVGSTHYSSESIGVEPIITHTPAIPTDCIAAVAIQTDDSPFSIACSSSVSDSSQAHPDDAAAEEAQSLNEEPEIEIEQPAGPPAILITPSNSSMGDLSMALVAALSDLRNCREFKDEHSLSPLYRSPQSTAPPSPVISEAPSFSIPDWRENQIFDPAFLRRYGLGPDGLRPSLSQCSSVEDVKGLLQYGDSHGVLPSSSTPLDAYTGRFGEGDLANFVFEFSVQFDVSEGEPEDRGASSSMGSGADSSGFEFVLVLPFKRCRREHEDGGAASLTLGGLAGGQDNTHDNSADDGELSMELASVLDEELDHLSTAGSESPSTSESEPLVIPNILIIVNSPPTTPPPSPSQEFDPTGFEGDIPMSSTPVKSRPSLDTFRDLCFESIRSQPKNLLASPCLDRHRAKVRSPSTSLSMSSLDLAHHLPPLTASENSDCSRLGSSSFVSGPGREGSVQSSLREAHPHRPMESASSDESTDHIPPTWSFDLEAYRHPPPVSTDDSFFIASCRSSVSSTSNAEPIPPVSESILDSAGMVAVEDHAAVAEDVCQEAESSLYMAESDENLLDQTFSAELAGCNDLGFEPLHDFEPAAPPLSSGALLDSTAELNTPPEATEPMAEVAEELSSFSLLLVKSPAPFALSPGPAKQHLGTNSEHRSTAEEEMIQNPVLCAMLLQEEVGPLTPTQDVTLTEAPEVQASDCEPRSDVFAKEAAPELMFDMSRLESLASAFSTPASKAYYRSFESLQKVLSPGAAATSPLRGYSSPVTRVVNLSRTTKVQESGWTPRSDVFVRECTPDLTFDTSSVASPGSASLTPTPMAHAQSFDFLQKASPTSRRGPTPSPLRECSNTSYRTPSHIPITKSGDIEALSH
ncbi:hypothetical protein BD410DRAFT_842783 [Rickenella mellea]|uniref:Uncharacterized protein n=1 Tax=Rickenella mellea TaxID=50990 RepID=A0A4Y7PTT7_9AGAM|nr:hypothetical protein BD410DRAFT_842783 [Rickenella mellea]